MRIILKDVKKRLNKGETMFVEVDKDEYYLDLLAMCC